MSNNKMKDECNQMPDKKPFDKRGKGGTGARGKKPNNKGGNGRGQFGSSASRRNELAWYNQNPLLTKAAASVPFPYRAGMAIPNPWGTTYMGSKTAYGSNRDMDSIPGLMAIRWIPSAGYSNTVTSPISMAARDLYSKIRSAFSGSVQVDAPDLIIHLLAMDSVYSYIEFLKRVYKIVNTFTPHNLLTPELMLRSMGFGDKQIAELKANKYKLYGAINELVLMTNKFNVPDVLPLFARHSWMNSRVYSDANTLNSQLYMFYQLDYLRFDVDEQGAGGLWTQTLNLSPPASIVDYLFNFGNAMLQHLSDWDDAYIINGYIQRAFGDGPMIKIEPLVDINAKLEIVYDEVVLSQIENLNVAPTLIEGNNAGIVTSITQQAQSNVVYAKTEVPNSKDVNMYYTRPSFISINSRYDTPSEGDVVEATRLKTVWNSVGSSTENAYAAVCGTEVITKIDMVHYVYDVRGNQVVESIPFTNLIVMLSNVNSDTGSVSVSAMQQFIRGVGILSTFDWHPIVPVGTAFTASGASVADTYTCGDVHNMTSITERQLAEINKICLYSEFNSFSM